MLRQALLVAPAARVVDDDRVADAVRRVVDRRGVVGVDDPDERAVREDRARLLVDRDRALEGPVHRIAPQQARALDEVVLAAATHDDRAQVQPGTVARVRDQDAREQPPDAAEAVQHDVGAARGRGRAVRGGEHLAEVVAERPPRTVQLEVAQQPRDVEGGRAGVELQQGIQHLLRVLERQHRARDVVSVAMRLDDADRRLVDEASTVDRGHHPVLAVETADERDELLGE